MFDLHFHSLASDGKATLEEIVQAAAAQPGLRALALTDHDHITSSIAFAALEPRAWIGAEIFSKHGSMPVDLLALNVRADHDELNHYLSLRTAERRRRFDEYGERLRADGWIFDPAAEVYANPQLARPHVVEEIRRHESNQIRLEEMGIQSSKPTPVAGQGHDDRIYPLLIDKLDVKGFVYSTTDTIALIHRAGGLAVLAHPFIKPYGKGKASKSSARRLLREMVVAGLDGIEAFHHSQDEAFRAEVLAQATELDLLVTAGSDDHEPGLPYLGSMLAIDHPDAPYYWAQLEEAKNRYR